VTLPQHSSNSNEHYTPTDIVNAAFAVMDGIDLDPATTAPVNERVGAKKFYTQEMDGLAHEWFGSVLLNPPGGKTKNVSNAFIWWEKLVGEYLAGRVTQAVFVGFTLEIQATSQDAERWVGDFPYCIPRNRLAFDHEVFHNFSDDGPIFPIGTGVLVSGKSPAHSNIIVYLPPLLIGPRGPRVFDGDKMADFVAAFAQFGKVRL
jgi:hypothetical protein